MENKFWKTVFASMLGFVLSNILFIFLLFVIVGVSIASLKGEDSQTIAYKKHTILNLSASLKVSENTNEDPLQAVLSGGGSSSITMYDAIKAIAYAKTDSKIDGIYLNLSDLPCGSANVEDLRAALIDFKASKKFIYAYSETYSQGGYYLASVADSVFANPQGGAIVKGLVAKIAFYKTALEKLGVVPQVIRHGKFKSAVEPYILDKMSPENRTQIAQIINVSWDNYLEKVSKSRNIPVALLDSLVNVAAFSDAKSCLEYHIIDRIAYEDEVLDRLVQKTEAENLEELSVVKLEKYIATLPEGDNSKKIALIYADGSINDGKGDDGVYSTNFVTLLRKIRFDEDIKGVVLRINSPGGSALASDVIWRELTLLKKANKALVVSMANVAASGGYYMAAPADRIFAYQTTITGSIGVFGVIPNTKPLVTDKLGISFDTVTTSRYADIMTVNRPLAEDEKFIIQKQIERIYDDFITKVGLGRHLEKSSVDSIGQGRVWMGSDALKIGLVDEIGGINEAINYCAKLTKISLKELNIEQYPKAEDPIVALQNKLKNDSKIKANILEGINPELFKTYKFIQKTFNQKGILAQMEFDVEIN